MADKVQRQIDIFRNMCREQGFDPKRVEQAIKLLKSGAGNTQKAFELIKGKATDLEPIPVEDAGNYSRVCRACGGPGKVDGKVCKSCAGSGKERTLYRATDSAHRARLHRALDAVMDSRGSARDSEEKKTQYFSANTSMQGGDAHKRAEEFLHQKEREGFVGYQSTYGNYGFSITYWMRPTNARDDEDDSPYERKMAAAKPGAHVVLEAGYGAKGGNTGQDFIRLSANTNAIIVEKRGSDIWVDLDTPHRFGKRWKFPAMAIKA